ncbi:MAG: glycosyltransferase family 9 protein [Rubripirellula sp.]
MSNEAAPRILICRMSSLGDTVLTMPIACALRDHFPKAHLAWLVEKHAASLIREHRALDEVLQVEAGWSESWSGVLATARMLQTHHFDVMIDCDGTTRTGMLGWLAAIGQRIGFSRPHSNLLNRCFNTEQVTSVFDHLTDRSLELLIPLGIHSPKVRWHLPIPAAARRWATSWTRNSPNPKLAILDPASGLNSKHWDATNFAKVACHLRSAYQYRSIICWSTHRERAFANRIVDQSRCSASLAPHTDLQHLAALLEQSDLFVSGAIEPLHVSVALGTPTINLHSATTDRNYGTYRQLTLQSGGDDESSNHFGGSGQRSGTNRKKPTAHPITFERVCDAVAEIESKQRLLRAS